MTTKKFDTVVQSFALASATGLGSLLVTTPAAAQPLPSYATGSTDETIHGTVIGVSGKYNVTVRDARGFADNVTLHDGTIINPTGLTIAPGQTVTILGRTQGSTFAANEIDTPYESFAAVPPYSPFGYGGYSNRGYGYGYGFGYGYPGYGVGVAFGRGYGFGFRGW